jgi:antitoxin (DNA-binding transcriptional repressor) of toxin-antitoxin stability system
MSTIEGMAVARPDGGKEARSPEPERVGVRELRGNLTGYLRRVRQGGSFLVTSHDQVLAELRPPPPLERPRRRPGALRGRIRMAPDFDTLPPQVLAAMEGEEG